jgi:uncharacterized protein (TIGR03066 family)
MRIQSSKLAVFLVLVLTGCGKPDPEAEIASKLPAKIVGTWEATVINGKPATAEWSITMTFTENGKWTQVETRYGKTETLDGTYTVDGTKVKTAYEMPNRKGGVWLIVQSMTDDSFVAKSVQNYEFKRK